ncbi:acyltransferase [Niveispirillum sp. SYP-B3756]|uniref:acyltransferase family protein n=1 Tax=Niveispirillum sp. SYP-B3756 TaxID=2662178 RepID=UPI0012910AAF|nr:acyltransferase [Niveispirillum sp. SYP-B3756]
MNREHSTAPIDLNPVPVIDGLRAIAIIGVVFHHFAVGYVSPNSIKSPINELWLPFKLILQNGWLGVSLFFFLSGAVLYLPYARGEKKMENLGDAKKFLRHRLERLLPLYYFVGFVCIGYGLKDPFNTDSLRDWVYILMLLTASFNFHPSSFAPRFNYPFWSIGLEIWFSLLFPLLLPLYQRHRNTLLIVAVAVTFLLRGINATPPNASGGLHWIADSLPARLPDFLFGMLAVDLVRARSRLLNWGSFIVLGIGGTFAVLALWHFWYLGVVSIYSKIFLTILLDISLLFCIGFLFSRHSWLDAVLTLWPLRAIGVMCYSIYLWHKPLLDQLVTGRKLNFIERIENLPLYIGFLLIISTLSYRYFEFGGRDIRSIFRLRPKKD